MSTFKKYFPPDLRLETDLVLLRLLQPEDIDLFEKISQSSDLWIYFTKQLNDRSQLETWLKDATLEYIAGQRMPFTILQKQTGTVCGSTSFGSISFYDQRIEIGWSWLGEEFRGKGINTHAKYLLLTYAFEHMMMERIEIKTDNLNERAKAALRKIGATEEGVLRSHMLMPGGRRRDSVYFSILKSEWPAVKQTVFRDSQLVSKIKV